MQKIHFCFWFDDKAEEAVQFYTSLFKHSKITHTERYSVEGAKASGRKAGSVMTITFQLEGQNFMALNGGPLFKFTPAISMMIYCNDQKEIDHFSDALSEGGRLDQCGWLTDKYGISWQIVPRQLAQFMQSGNPTKSANVMKALLQMKKIDIATLKNAFASD